MKQKDEQETSEGKHQYLTTKTQLIMGKKTNRESRSKFVINCVCSVRTEKYLPVDFLHRLRSLVARSARKLLHNLRLVVRRSFVNSVDSTKETVSFLYFAN